MVDFYGETLDHRNYARSQDPFAGNPYFDAGPYYYWTGRILPVRFGGGGMRSRLLRVLCERRPEQISGIFGEFGPDMAKSWKVPLLKHGNGVLRLGDHEISVPPRPDAAAALAHFKFHPDLDAKIDQALREKQYRDGSIDYRFLKAAIELLGRESLIGAETRRFEGPESLERAELLTPLDPAGRSRARGA